MIRRNQMQRGTNLVVLVILAIIAGWVVLAGSAKRPEVAAAARAASLRPNGSAQLIASEPLPSPLEDGEMCEWQPASASGTLEESLFQEERSTVKAAPASGAASTIDFSKRQPVRMIRDPYAAYSAVAIDPVNNEVVLTDENLFNILVYDRLANTPPRATMTEPKRMIGGLKTNIEFQCGLYIDPKNGDIYAVNNDTVDRLVIFSRQARGDVPPDRDLHTPHGTFGVAVDEEHQELMLTVQHDSAIVTYHKNAKPEDSPVRLIQGDHTLLADPHGMALDTNDDLIFVTNHGSVHQVRASTSSGRGRRGAGKENWPLQREDAILGSGKNVPPSITVYPRTATGDAAPLRVIQGPNAQLDWPTGIAYDPQTDEIFVANDMGDSILVFPASATGDVAPTRILKGPKSLVKNPTGVYVDVQHDEVWAANFGNHTATVYKPTASGDTAPLRVIRSGPLSQPSLGIGNPHPVAYDAKREQILVPN